MTTSNPWHAFAEKTLRVDGLDFLLDLSTLAVTAEQEQSLAPAFERAFAEMKALEEGAIANLDEGRQVGHYWLRAPGLAPGAKQRQGIVEAIESVKRFAGEVHRGEIVPARGLRFRRALMVGIGGSALGPQLAYEALGGAGDALALTFLDNTDPDGFEKALDLLGEELGQTLVVVTSKSGGTAETRNGLEEVCARLVDAGCNPARHLVAVTGEGSKLENRAREEGWITTFPMWDWIGGRTSETSVVGLLPMALAGHDVDALLEGARLMDTSTRVPDLAKNPAARLALAWHVGSDGCGRRDMVVIPYRDRLSLLARYLQQLVMESLGKEKDLSGNTVRQGLAVYGNKGSTDQHAYVQQLREGVDNYFLTLVATMEDPPGPPLEVEPGITSGDYLLGFMLGTRRALTEDSRRVMTLVLPRIDARTLGGLIALFERAVGLYASLVGINAYHQPGVEAGKKAAASVLTLQLALVDAMGQTREALTAPEWAEKAGFPEFAVEAFWVLEHLAQSPRRGVSRQGQPLDPGNRYSQVTASS